MAATQYDDQKTYIKFLKEKSLKEGHEHGCGCDSCGDDKCGCCPPGLIAIFDDNQNQIACLSPNDAELYRKNTSTCQDGYLRLVRLADGEFFGCVSEENFKDLYDNINGLSS